MADLADSQSADSKLPDTAAAPLSPTSNAPKAELDAPPDPRDMRGARRARWGIALLVALFLITLWQRDTIRAHWWATRLMATDDLAARGQYLSFLATAGDKATGAVWRLARDDRPDIRMLAVFAATKLSRPASSKVLAELLGDHDVETREAAGRALVFALNGDALGTLLLVSSLHDEATAASAVASCSRSDSPLAAEVLMRAASHSLPGVRAQAIESIAYWIESSSACKDGQSSCSDLLLRLIELTRDDATFIGELSMEREIESVTTFVRAGHHVAIGQTAPGESRAVSEVATAQLSRLSGRTIIAEEIDSLEARQSLARAILERIETSRLRPSATSLPIDLEKQIGNPQEPSESTP